MDYKEAIEFLKVFLEYARKNRDIPIYDRYIHNGTFLVNDVENLKEVISLLQQGEAYKQMWEHISVIYKGHGVESDIKALEQKYLKEAKQDEG